MQLLTQNSDLKRTGIYAWTLPAHWVTLTNGEKVNTCPNAGICAGFCYAKAGRWLFSNVKKAHTEKLELVLYKLQDFYNMMVEELRKKKYKAKYIRIHDGGDFFSFDYTDAWLSIIRMSPQCQFYTYTKEVLLFKQLKERNMLPKNFTVIYSFGGKQDKYIDRDVDRHSDVFPDYDEMIQAGYVDISHDDKQAAININHRIGLYRNNIPHLVKKMGNKKFSDWSR